MINAKKARELAEVNKVSNAIANIEKSIKKAVERGRDSIITMEVITEAMLQTLTDAGYKVEQQISGTKISW